MAVSTYAYLPGDYSPYSMTTSAGATYYLLKNARGDVTALSDTAGTVVAKYRYDPWGNILSITDGNSTDVSGSPSHIANVNPWRYAGYYFDKESGMYYLQARYYRADLMRFISVDPEPDENLYAYGDSNPVMLIDPNGNNPVIRFLQALGRGVVWVWTKIGSKFKWGKRSLSGLKSKSMDYALKPNKLRHYFTSKHKLQGLVEKCGSRKEAVRRVVHAAYRKPKAGESGSVPKKGNFNNIVRMVKGVRVKVTGHVDNGVIKIGNMWHF